MDKLHENIGREIFVFTTAIFPSFETDLRLDPPGTGTFVYFRDSYYILTAAHVWDKVRQAPEMGLSLKDGIAHRFLLPSKAIKRFGPDWPGKGHEWGPDIALLRLPLEIVADIKVHKAFYDIEKNRSDPNAGIQGEWQSVKPAEALKQMSERKPGQRAQLEGRVLMGTPKEFATFRQGHAHGRINAMFMGIENWRVCSVGNFDFVDLDVDAPSEGIPNSFEGVSGGGLWRYIATVSDDGDKTTKFLEGIAFYQLTGDGGQRRIRCHGKQSLTELMKHFPTIC